MRRSVALTKVNLQFEKVVVQNVGEEEDVLRGETGSDVLHSQDRAVFSGSRRVLNLTVGLAAQVGQDHPAQLQALVDSHQARIDLSLLELQHQILDLSILRKEVLQQNLS